MFEKSGTNVGSLCKIEVVEYAHIDTMPLAHNGILIGTPTLKAGKTWEDVYFTLDTAHLVEREIVMGSAEVYDLIVKWSVPKDKKTHQQSALLLKKTRWIARLTDINGTVIIAGTPEEPCSIRRTIRDKGQSIRDSNLYMLELKLTRSESAPILVV